MKLSFFGYEIEVKIKKKKKFEPIKSPVTQKKDIDINRVLLMKDNGLSNRAIARKLNVSEGTIRNRLKNL